MGVEPVDEWEAALLEQHGPEVLRAVQRYMRPEKPKPKPRLKSSESAQQGQVFAKGRVLRRLGNRDSL